MRFRIDRRVDEIWYPVGAAVEAESAAEAVDECAGLEGLYRAASVDAPQPRSELFRVPQWGFPISLGSP